MVIEMVDGRAQMNMMNKGMGDNTAAGSGSSRVTGFERYIGTSTVNPDCHFRKRKVNMQRVIKNTTLKGRLADSATQTQRLKKEVQSLHEMKEIGAFVAA